MTCKHEWRYATNGKWDGEDDCLYFYCIKCLRVVARKNVDDGRTLKLFVKKRGV